MQRKLWNVAPSEPVAEANLQRALGCSGLVARLLVRRGITTPEEAHAFLNPSFDQLADSFLLPDALPAVERIKQALANRETIYIHGDYDGDGVTSAALWTRLLAKLGADVRVHVPHRHRDGYDMRSKFVAQARSEGAKLILTADCGIQRCEEVEEARQAGIDVVITDHHEPGDRLPRAVAVVNPHRKDSVYPFPYLAGVGVAYRMGEALVRHLGLSVDSYRRAYADLAAIGTVTDIMPIQCENRIIIKYGLKSLSDTRKPGLRALLNSSGLGEKPLDVDNIGYVIGPRLNAVGRIDDSRLALDLLLTRDPGEATRLAAKLESTNADRRQEQARIQQEALQQIASRDMQQTACLVLASDHWHPGVIGIVANKLVELYHRPTVLIAIDPEAGQGRGSARSIRAFDLYRAIVACRHRLLEHGGHSHAAGFSIRNDEVPAFAEEMNQIAASTLSERDFLPTLDIDSEIEVSEVTPGLLNELCAFEPWGRGNPQPLLLSRGLEVREVRRVGKEQNHLKMLLRGAHSPTVEAVMWGEGNLAEHVRTGTRVDVCYRPRINEFNGRTNIQFVVQDMRPSDVDDI